MEDLTGKQLGPYQIIEPLGEGGMAAVYKAFQPSMERYVALKILPRHFASDPEFVGRFEQEAKVIANLQHPHILPVHDFGESDGYTYLTMRFIQGGTLSDWLKERTPLPMEKIRRVITQVGGALDYAHAQGVIHRDIKPSNILVDQWDNSLLTDFGLAKMVATSSHLTQTGGILGTPAYMSPEQGLGQKIDHRSDIYSLGVVLYQMAVGHLPYQAETPMAVVIKHIHDPLPPPRQRDPNLPEAVELVILKALAKNPDDRYHTAGDLVKALEEAATTPTIQAAASPAADTAVAPPPPEPEPEPTPDPTPATVVMESASTAVAPPPSHTEPEPKPAPPPPSSPAHPPADAPPRKKWRLTRRWVIAGGALLFVCCILFAIAASSQNRNGDNGDGAANEEIQATAEVAINEAVGEIINDTLDNPDLPEVAKARIAIALDAFREGNVDKALEAFDEAIAAAPENADIYCERGYIFRDMERLGDAVADFEKCFDLAQQQDNPEQANNALGEAAYTQAQITFNETDNLDEALAVIDPALEAGAPDWLRCERGEFILMAMGPDTAVIPDFEACAQTMTEDEYWSWRSNSILAWVQGTDALNNEEYETAVGRFEEWANLVPDAPWPQCYLAYALDGLGDYPRAETAFQACHDLADDEETRQQAIGGLKFVESHIATDKGEMLEALTANQEAINLLPDDPWLYCERAEIYLTLGQPDPASENAQACLEHGGEDAGTREWAESLIQDIQSGG